MTTRATVPKSGGVASDKILSQLTRVIAGTTFHQVDRLKRFLTFVVTETAAGRGDHLKEYLIGTQVFDKEVSFDPRTDPIVRVQARRLRARLVRYYREEGQADEILIDLPKGGYAPVFKQAEAVAPRVSAATALVGRNTVAVLPFSDHSATASLGWFCKGICQEIIQALAEIDALRVIAWDTAKRDSLAGDNGLPEATLPDAAIIVTGSTRQAGNQLRVAAQLVDGASGVYLWSASFDGDESDILALQAQVARGLAARLRDEPLAGGTAGGVPGVNHRGSRKPSENLAARNLYLQGRYHLGQRTEEAIRKAVDFFEKGVVEDGQYALAYSGLSDAYGLLAHYGILAPAEVWTKAASHAATAVMLDENSAESHTSLAHVRSTQDWDWKGAEKEFLHAIRLDPRYPTARHWFAMSCLAPLGRLDDALEQLSVAQSLDPVSSIIARDLAVGYYYKREFEAALDQCDNAIELSPHFSPAYLTLGLIQERRREFDEAAAALERANHFSPQSPRVKGSLARVFAMSGRRRQALKILGELHVLGKTRYVSPFDFACIHFEMGEPDEGFQWLTRAFEDRCFELICLRVDPRFDAIKDDPRFRALAARLGLDAAADQPL